ncbi:MAG: NADH-quinone oxidoreductase subunit L [Planctomycetes bacterium]|nr:NADH-quinone oxidoreductase subunit L [Planctomycetota bacterium]
MSLLLEATYTLNSVFPEVSHGFPWQCALGLACFLLPVAGFFLQVLFGKHLPRQGDWLPVGAMFCSFLCAVGICVIHLRNYDPNYAVEWRWNWMSIEGDGKGVKHTPENFAKLHLGDALSELGLLDAQGKPADGSTHLAQLQAALNTAKSDKARFEGAIEAAKKDASEAGDDKAKAAGARADLARNSAWLAEAEAEIARLSGFVEKNTDLAKRFKEIREKPEFYLNDLTSNFEVDEARANAPDYRNRPGFWRSQVVLNWLHSSDGKKRAENHAQFDKWLSGASVDAKFTRDALAQHKREQPASALINEENTLKNAFAIGVYIDNTTAITIFMVTLLSFLIHLFSTGYMAGEVRYARFFATINLFTVGMIGLVLANNFLWLFVCWEIMGLCSYLLIGHYYEKPSAQAACIKAFITTRIGDCFMFVGMMIIFINTGTTLFSGPNEFQAMFAGWQEGAHAGGLWGLTTYAGPGSMFALLGAKAALIGGGVLTVMGILLFIGPVGKSAQFPLHVWLPDAMEGPTPVSAMIHAACMVSAGVYLTARLFPFFTPDALHVIAFVGGFTALFAGTIGLMQTDIKKVLAFSTISQLGYMFLGIGVGAWAPAVFHMLTHAFFKALMFLGSGSVILGCSHEQEMTRMGGLWKKMPITAATFWIGNLAITGAPFFFSGFYSKEAVLTQAAIFGQDSGFVHLIPYIFGALGAGLTTFYMFRLVWMTFHGKPRDQWVYDHAKESPWNVVLPLIIISGFAAVVGWPLAAKTSMAENLGFTNVVEFGVLAWLTIVLSLMGGLYLFRRRNDPHVSSLMRGGAWSMTAGMPALLALAILFGYLGLMPRTTNAGPHGEAVAEFRDTDSKELAGVRQHDRPRALVEANEQELLAEIKKRVETKHGALSGDELDKVVAQFERKLAEAVKAAGQPKVSGRPDAEGQSWFSYLIQKPRSAYSRDFLVQDARYEPGVVDLLYVGADGRPLTADAPGMQPSLAWGARYNEWRKQQGLLHDPRFAQTEKQVLKEVDEHHAKHLADEIKKANVYEEHEHGAHDDHGHEGHSPDKVAHAWHEKHHKAHVQVFGGSMVAFLIGLALSMFFFSPWGPFYRREWVGHVGFLASTRTALKRGYYLDELYYGTVVAAQAYLMRACAWFDKVIVDGIVNLVGKVSVWLGFVVAKADFWGVDGTVRGISNATGWAGATASKAPTGKISDYVFMLIGAIVVIFILLALLS